MRLVVADTGPLNYLVLIGAIDLLPKLFETVLVPQAVCDELCHRVAPAAVRAWTAQPPAWLDVRPVPAAGNDDPAWRTLDTGERAALYQVPLIRTDVPNHEVRST
jgi:predicted nucleic acid-binding protein